MPDGRELPVLVAGFYALAAFRGLDAVLDSLVPWMGWKIGPTLILPLMLGLLIARGRRKPG